MKGLLLSFLAMKTVGMFFLIAISNSIYAEDWFELDSHSFEVTGAAGWGENDASVRHVSLWAQLPYFAELSARLGDAEQALSFGRDETFSYTAKGQNRSVYLSSDPLARYSVTVSYEDYEFDDRFESRDVSLALATNIGSWNISLRATEGDVDIIPSEGVLELIEGLVELGVFSASKTSLGATLAYTDDDWSVSLFFTDYTFKRDNEPDESDLLTVLEGLSEEDRQALRRLILFGFGETLSGIFRWQAYLANQQYQHQVSQLAEQEMGLDFIKAFEHAAVGLGIYGFRSRVSGNVESSMYASVEIPVSDSLFVTSLFSVAEEAGSYGELGFGIRW